MAGCNHESRPASPIGPQINLRGYKCGYLTFCLNFQVEPNRIFEARKQVWESLRTFENLDRKLYFHIYPRRLRRGVKDPGENGIVQNDWKGCRIGPLNGVSQLFW